MKAFFLDRDGVLIAEKNYLKDPADVELIPGAPEALKKIREAGFRIIMVSNQSGIARGYFTFKDLKQVENRIEELLTRAGSIIPDAWYYCPHHPEKGTVSEYVCKCTCRKPEPGLFLQAIKDFGIEPEKSAVIGDKLTDLEAGFNAGCRIGALVLTGHGSEQEFHPLSQPYLTAENLPEAVDKLLETAGK